jgi:Transposase and inactivated derivatives
LRHTKYNKDAHRVYSLIFHIILIVKYRKKVFENQDIIDFTKETLDKISHDFQVSVLEQECGCDHIHLLISAKPTIDITKYLNILKGHSSRAIRSQFKEFLKDKLWGDSFWSDSYFIATAGNVSIDDLKKYIENQNE